MQQTCDDIDGCTSNMRELAMSFLQYSDRIDLADLVIIW